MSRTVLGCIADDFTGATDLAGVLRRSGADVSLRTGVPTTPPDQGSSASIEIIALKCRTIDARQAVKQALAAFDWLKAAGAKRFFWKYCSTFDSTPAGNIGPVAEALMRALDSDQTIYCPAFPENGRSIFMGHLFVGEELLDESPMKDHPLTPMRDSNLMRLLQPQVERTVGLANRLVVAQGVAALSDRLEALRASGVPHVIVDAVSSSDLETIAGACVDMPLITGGSAVAETLPALYRETGFDITRSDVKTMPPTAFGSLVLSGSCSAMTRKQVADYEMKAETFHLDPVALAANGHDEMLEWLNQTQGTERRMISATADPETVRAVQAELGRETAGAVVEEALGAAAVAARDLGIDRIVAAGGETSGAVVQALGVDRMVIGPEIALGVPWTHCQSGGRTLALALKSGNFGSETFFADALDMLENP